MLISATNTWLNLIHNIDLSSSQNQHVLHVSGSLTGFGTSETAFAAFQSSCKELQSLPGTTPRRTTVCPHDMQVNRRYAPKSDGSSLQSKTILFGLAPHLHGTIFMSVFPLSISPYHNTQSRRNNKNHNTFFVDTLRFVCYHVVNEAEKSKTLYAVRKTDRTHCNCPWHLRMLPQCILQVC